VLGILEGLGVDKIRRSCLYDLFEDLLVLWVGEEFEVIPARVEAWLSIVCLGIGSIDAQEIELRVHISDQHMRVVEDRL